MVILARIWKVVVGLFAVLGAVGTLITINGGLFPSTDQVVLGRSVDLPLAYRSRTFPVQTTVGSVDAGNQDMVQTEVTLWRDGGLPITAEMVRRPLRISPPGGSHVVAFQVVGTESSVPDNFHVARDGDDLLVTWKVFDPDMALKVAFVRTVATGTLQINDDLGPGVRTSNSRYGVLKVAVIAAFVIFLTALIMAVVFGLFALLIYVLKQVDKILPYLPLRLVVGILGTALTLAAAYEGIQYDGQIAQWVTDRSVKAIPFQTTPT